MPAGFNYGKLSFGQNNPFNFDEEAQKYPTDVSGLNIAIIGYGGNVTVGGAHVAEGRWTNIDESNIHNLFLQGYFPLESITRVRRNPKSENPELGGKDSRGKFKPDLTETTKQLKSCGVDFYDIPELNINDYVIKRDGMAHDFDSELWERLSTPDISRPFDIILLDVGTLDRLDSIDRFGQQITHDAHYKWGDAALQLWKQQELETDDPARVLGIETPLAVSYGAAKHLVGTSRKQDIALVCKGLVEYVHPERDGTLRNSKRVV